MPFHLIPESAITGTGKASTKIPVAVPGNSPSHVCCENIRSPSGSPAGCSCHGIFNHSRISGLTESLYGASGFPSPQGFIPLGTRDGSAFYSPLTSVPYDVKDSIEAWRGLTQAGPCFPYDSNMTIYPYGPGYAGIDLNARRKNATRETTTTLKAWLYEHRKNPYPTKGEKIMLAIITKMTLTQVSTWFANARRRLKKENKMTWSPRHRSDDDDDNDEDFDRDCQKDESELNVYENDENCEDKDIGDDDGRIDDESRIEVSIDSPESIKEDSNSLSSFDEANNNKSMNNNGLDLTVNTKNNCESKKTIDTIENFNNKMSDGTSASETKVNITSTSNSSQNRQQNVSTARPKIWSVSELLNKSSDVKKSDDTQDSKIQSNPRHRFAIGHPHLPVSSASLNGIPHSYPFSMSHQNPYAVQMSSLYVGGLPGSLSETSRTLLGHGLNVSSTRDISKH